MKGQTTYDLYGASDGGHPIAENTGGAWYREAIMDGVRWGWLYQNGDGRFTLPDVLGPAALWAQTFALDPFGNLKSEGSVNWQPNYDGSNHASNTAYDADGNTLNDGFHAYSWDAAGEMATVDSSQAVYDALGRRVEGAGAEWLYAPSGGNRLALMGGQSLNFAVVPLPGGFAVYNSAGLALYQHADWLGSSRVDSTPARTATSLTAYAPYGDPDNGMSDLGFTGKGMNLVNGATAGLYDFPFREYQPTAGRWLSPDPAGLAAVNPADPASWNRYAYVGNQPLSAVDPLGLCNPDDPSAECQQGLQSEKTAEGCLGAAPGSALFQACGGYGGYAGGGAWWQQLPDEFDLLTLPVAVDGATWVPGTTSAGPSGSLMNGSGVVGTYSSSIETFGHFDWNQVVGAGSGIFLRPFAPQFSGIDYTPAPAVPPSSARLASPPLPTYSHSYVAQLACEFGHVAEKDNLTATVVANVAPAFYAFTGNLPNAARTLGLAAVWDIGGAFSIRARCVAAVYGPGTH